MRKQTAIYLVFGLISISAMNAQNLLIHADVLDTSLVGFHDGQLDKDHADQQVLLLSL